VQATLEAAAWQIFLPWRQTTARFKDESPRAGSIMAYLDRHRLSKDILCVLNKHNLIFVSQQNVFVLNS